jgi:hypothetical protein
MLTARSAEIYPIAPQTGPSCGFYANVPALTYASGVNIAQSTSFIRSIYQLHRGDRRIESSFSKEKFYELFAIPYSAHEVKHENLTRDILRKNLISRIEESFDAGLSKGYAYSLRVTGVFGGPHNALLLEKISDQYVVHDPYPGLIKQLTKEQLADWMLVPTSATKDQDQPRYITQYLEVELSHRHQSPWLTLDQLPTSLQIVISPEERALIQKALAQALKKPEGQGIDALMEQYPLIDFAAISDHKDGKSFSNAINDTLKESELTGVINLAKFTLAQWHLRRQSRISVMVLDGRPHAFLGYQPSKTDDKIQATLLCDDGTKTLAITIEQALRMFKKSGCHYGSICLPNRK